MTVTADNQPRAMAFYGQKELGITFSHAARFAGRGGRVASLPDILAARVHSGSGLRGCAWNHYFTTSTCEMVGRSPAGNMVMAILHGTGPLSTRRGIETAYKHVNPREHRNNKIGAIPEQVFHEVLSGLHGPVSTLDMAAYTASQEYPFDQRLNPDKAYRSELLRFRAGDAVDAYIGVHVAAALRIRREQEGKERGCNIENLGSIICLSDDSSFGYSYNQPQEGLAFAHLLSIGGVAMLGETAGPSTLNTSIEIHSANDGVRFAGIRKGGPHSITPAPDIERILGTKKGREILLRDYREPPQSPPYCLMECDGTFYTQKAKEGARMDTGVAFHPVRSMDGAGSGVMRTTAGGYYGFLKYDIDEVRRIMPPGANAYRVGDVSMDADAKMHTVTLRFYNADVDTDHRLLNSEEVMNDYSLLTTLAEAA